MLATQGRRQVAGCLGVLKCDHLPYKIFFTNFRSPLLPFYDHHLWDLVAVHSPHT